MCGIFGYLSVDAGLDPSPILAQALEALHHRGPDDRGTVVIQAGSHRGGLAQTRLAIIDLSPGGHQPATSDDGRFTIVYNGEVYNFAEIRAELVGLGDRFRSSCDTEVVLKAYARWGREALTRFRGMFALAIWDARERALFIARDRLGVKPLYIVERGSGIAFASEVRALLATGLAGRRLSRRGLATYLAYGAVSGPDTILEDARSLPPGTFLEWRSGRVETGAFWSLPVVAERHASAEDEVGAIRPILEDAVRLRMIADVPIGVFLSGGIDSTVLVALATRASATPVHTFTVTFDETEHSEAAYADEVARHYGCDHHEVRLSTSTARQHVAAAAEAMDQPSADGVNTYLVSRAAKEAGLTVALSGLGGDEVFAGYGHFRNFGRLRRVSRWASVFAAEGLFHDLEGRGGLPSTARKLSMALGSGGSMTATYAALRAMFTPREIEAFGRRDPGDPDDLGITASRELIEADARGDVGPINVYSALELRNYLHDTLLRDADAMSMAHALEVRVPFLDHRLVERVMRAPGAVKLSAHGNKPLLTGVVPDMPGRAVHRRKMGFTLPYDAWFRGPMRPWLEDLLLGTATRRLGLFDDTEVARIWRAFLRGSRTTTQSRIWCLASLASWCRQHRGTLA